MHTSQSHYYFLRCFNEVDGSTLTLFRSLSVKVATAKIIATAKYMHIWHECLAMTNGKIMVRLKTETEHFCNRSDIVQDSLWNKSYL